MAEAQHVKVIPHNPLSPISTAACVQLDACIPNFALQEYTGESEPPKSDLLVNPLKLERGYLVVPETPGLGIELNEAALTRPPRPGQGARHADRLRRLSAGSLRSTQ